MHLILGAQGEEDLAVLVSMGFGEARARRALAQLARAGANTGDMVQAAMERMLADPEGAHDDAADEAGYEATSSNGAAGAQGEGGGPADDAPAQEVSERY